MKMKMKMNRKIAIFFAVFFFSFNIINVYQVSADSASLTVGGGSLGTGGLETLEGLLPFATPIIMSILHQANMDIKLTQQSQAAGMTKTQYLYDQILNWKEGAPEAVSQVCERILTGTSIDSEGIIYVGQTALDAIRQFGNWIISDAGENFTENVSTPSAETVSVNNIDIPYMTNAVLYFSGSHTSVYYTTSENCMFLYTYYTNAPVKNLYAVGESGTTVHVANLDYAGNITSEYSYSLTATITNSDLLYAALETGIGGSGYVTNAELPILDASIYGYANAAIVNFFSGVNSSDISVPSADIPSDTFLGKVQDWIDNLPSLDLPDGYTGAIDYGILDQILQELEQDKQFEMTVADYLQAINEAINEQAIDVPIENVDDGTIAYVPDVVVVPDPAYDPVADPDIPDPEQVTPVIDESEPPSFEDLMNQPLTLDLKNFFPFCIPFDLYNLFQKFNAPAVAPHFRINFTIPIINQEVDYTIDFSPFNDVAAVLRTMELIAMVVLLALATRRIFLRG